MKLYFRLLNDINMRTYILYNCAIRGRDFFICLVLSIHTLLAPFPPLFPALLYYTQSAAELCDAGASFSLNSSMTCRSKFSAAS